MARKAKRLLALLLALLLCVSLLPATALAEGEDEETGTIALVEEPDGENGAIATAPEKSDPEALPEEAAAGDIPIDEAHFPDKAFRAYVSENFDADGNGWLSDEERAGVISIDLFYLEASRLTGIEHFTALQSLMCWYSKLTELDLSGNPALKSLDCSHNHQLTELNVRANGALEKLICNNNSLTELDLSGNPALQSLECGSNDLGNLELRGCHALRTLYCREAGLTELNISGCAALESVVCSDNSLTALDLSGNPELKTLDCASNALTALDLTNNPALTFLDCSDNSLTALDLSANPALGTLYCNNNSLSGLNISANTELTQCTCQNNELAALDVLSNTKLVGLLCYNNHLDRLDISNCPTIRDAYLHGTRSEIEEDGGYIRYALRGNLGVDESTLIISESGIPIDEGHFPDDSFRAYVSNLFDDDENGWLSDEEQLAVTSLDVSGLGLTSLTGIEYFPELTELYAGGDFETPGLLTRVDLSANTKLATLDLGFNPLTGLDVTMLPALESLMVGFCGLGELDLSGNPALRELLCDDNALTALDLSHNPALEHLDCCGNTELTRLDICSCPKLVAAYLAGGRHLEWMQELNPELYESIVVYGGSGDEDYDFAVNTYTEIIYPLPDGYYLIGPDWNYGGIYGTAAFAVNPEKPEEYMLRTTLIEGDKIKVVRVEDNAIVAWYPDGLGNEYVVDADRAGLVEIYFKPDYDNAWSEFGGFIWIGKLNPAVIIGKSLSLKGKIAVNFYLDLPENVTSDPDAYVTINDVKYLVSEAEQSEVRANTGYRFTVSVKFAHLQDEQVLRLYNGRGELLLLMDSEGKDLTETGFVYRAQDYIEYVRANSEDEGLLAVVNALSDLGSLAQAQFKYNVDSRADLVGDLASVTADMVKEHELKLTTAENPGIRYYGSSLLLKDDTTVRHYFKLETGEIGDYSFTVDGAELEPAEKGGLYYVDITGIVARDLDKSFHVEVLKGGETVIGLDYSALSYACTTLSRGKTDTLTELAKAVVLYSKAANAYLPE